MPTDDFDRAMEQAIAKINELPIAQRAHLLDLVRETRDRRGHIQQSVRRAMDALDDMRLVRKYEVFDREARLRELADALRRKNAEEQNEDD
ncbi:MAG: hypothetical protein ACE5D3_06450 [Candidatus Binatia bacterium]